MTGGQKAFLVIMAALVALQLLGLWLVGELGYWP